MCCFLVPLAQAVVVSAYRKTHTAAVNDPASGMLLRRLPDLEKMLWGGTLMLIVDHVINGELTWRFPFFTALGQTGGGEVMLREVLTVGVPMALALTLVWAVWAALKERRAARTTA
jgi:hypothetical protein